ncbi:MAG: methyltransferase, partial [Actinomycetota bacterium]
MEHHGHRPMMSEDRAAMLWEWHRRAAAGLAELGRHTTNYLGLYLVILEDVFPPTPTSDLLGSAVLDEAGPGDRVLDMGTGGGSNALLAARTASDVIGVDINPAAVAAATANAVRNGLADRARSVVGDLFEPVDGRFDLIIYDPPFRWLRPRSTLEQAVADEGYRSLTRFMAEVGDRLSDDGRLLLFFGTTGDIDYLHQLLDDAGL